MAILDDLVSEPLQSWTPEVLSRLRAEGKGETLFFEFKSQFDCADVEKTVCAFANAHGGILMFGVVADTDNRLSSFPGLDPGSDWLVRVSDCVTGHVSALPTWDTVAVDSPDVPGNPVIVTRIERSDRTPHLLTKSGAIYVRVPGGSERVRDKASLDALVARGHLGTEFERTRAESILIEDGSSDLITPPDHAWEVRVVAVPSPALAEGAVASLLTRKGMDAAGSIFDGPSLGLFKPWRINEDSVDLVGGYANATRYSDGSLFVRRASIQNVGVSTISEFVAGVLKTAANQSPLVRQVRLLVRLSGIEGKQLAETESGGRPSQKMEFDVWTWSGETPTDDAARQRVAASIARRLWRSVHDTRGHEPDA